MTIAVIDEQSGRTIGLCTGPRESGVCPQSGGDDLIFCAGHSLRSESDASDRWRWQVAGDAHTCPLWAAGR